MQTTRTTTHAVGRIADSFTPRYLAAIVVVAFVMRLAAGEIIGGGLSSPYKEDENDYAGLATRVVQGLGFTNKDGAPTSYRTPGLPLLLAMPISLVGPDILVMRVFMALVGSLLVPACYLLGRAATDSQRAGWIAAVVAAVFPTWVIPSSSLLSDVPTTVSITFMTWMLIEGYRRESLAWIGGAGILWAISTLIRPVCLAYAAGIVPWLLLMMRDWRMRIATVMTAIVCGACILAPWTIRNRLVHGRFVLTSTTGGIELYKANNPDATGILAIDHEHFEASLSRRYPVNRYPNEAVRSNLFQVDAVDFIRNNPSRFAHLCFVRFVQFWKAYSPRVALSNNVVMMASFGLALPLFVVQVIRLAWRPGPEMLFLFMILSQTGLHMVFPSIVRYRMPIEPLIILMAITGGLWTLAHCGALRSKLVFRDGSISGPADVLPSIDPELAGDALLPSGSARSPAE